MPTSRPPSRPSRQAASAPEPAGRYKYHRALRHIADELLPTLRKGDLLPSVEALCAMTEVSSITVNRALRLLSDSGRIQRVKRKGSVVLQPRASHDQPADASSPATVSAAPGRQPMRILGISTALWHFMKVIEAALEAFKRHDARFDYRIDHLPHDDQWRQQMARGEHDLILVNSLLMRQVATTPELARHIQPLEGLSGLHFEASDFHPAAIAACRHAAGWHTLPVVAGPMLQVINPRHPGLSAASPPCLTHWPSYMDTLASLRQADSPMLFLSTSPIYLEVMLRQQGLSLFSDDGRRCLMDQPAVIDFMQSLCRRSSSPKLILSTSSPSPYETANGQDVIHQAIAVRWASMIDFTAPADRPWRIAPTPTGPTPSTHLFIEGVMVGRHAPRGPAADFLNHLQSAAVQTRLVGCSGLSARLDMLPLQLASLEPSYQGLTTSYHASMAHARLSLPHTPIAVAQAIHEQLILMYNGLVPPAQGCLAAAQAANALLATRDDPSVESSADPTGDPL